MKLRGARALMHDRYDRLWQKVNGGDLPDGADIADVRAICVHATDIAVAIATMAYHFAGNTGLHHPHVIGRGHRLIMLEKLIKNLREGGAHFVTMERAVTGYRAKYPDGRSERGR